MMKIRIILAALLVLITGCGPRVLEPGIYDKKLHSTYMPFGDTAFLIPNETWLKRFAVNAATKEIDYIQIHATVDGQPWSEKVHDRMYPGEFQGDRLEIVIKFHSHYTIEKRKEHIQWFKTLPYSIKNNNSFKEVASPYDGWKAYENISRTSYSGGVTYNPIIYVFEENAEVKYLMDDLLGEKITFAYNDYALVEVLFSPFRQDEQMARAIQTAEFFDQSFLNLNKQAWSTKRN